MKKESAIRYYGKAKDLAKALGISSSAVSQWGDYVPEKQARRLERITEGRLKVDEACYVYVYVKSGEIPRRRR